ncbi:hypothetical protein MLD38_018393 [Melastoma candidum]|uniref:Uncharacterized protein n=1 Tax=Melastoma candidum TaxID=119954 RepID=A0ACB9QTM3_9MYRT|nr:hypothetical protein MLD38_018393 [Melastoma candidum]
MRLSPRPHRSVAHFPFQAHGRRRFLTSLFPKGFRNRPPCPPASLNNSNHHHHSKDGSNYLVPGATVATLLMLSALHARRLYGDKKMEEARVKEIEVGFQPDLKAAVLRMLPLRTISRSWGYLASIEVPVWMRPYLCKAWARAFHSNLEEVALPLEEYASLRDFFVRGLKEGSRPIDSNSNCLVSPVDGIILRCGKLMASRGIIEQVKGATYSVTSLLGGDPIRLAITESTPHSFVEKNGIEEKRTDSLSTVSLTSAEVRDVSEPAGSLEKGLFYCVIYLRPGDYHRIHSPTDWNVHTRRHFSGRLYPMNERAVRTIRNLYVENERVVLEGQWQAGMMAMAAVGATNIGSIELFIEPELQTNQPRALLLQQEPPRERYYEPEGVGIALKKGDELGAFNMGSTVVLVFQAPTFSSGDDDSSSSFRFCVKQGDRIRVGQALGRWRE